MTKEDLKEVKPKEAGKKGRGTIAGKLTLTIVFFVVVILAAVIGASVYLMQNTVTKLSENGMKKETLAYENEMEGWVNSILAPLNAVAETLRTVEFKSDDEVLNYLHSTMKISGDLPVGVYMGDNTNRYIDPSGWVPDSNFIVKDRSWYKLGLTADKMTFGEPYIGANTGEFMVSAATKINSTTVAAADVPLGKISEMVSSINVLGDGYAFLVDTKTGSIIAHNNSEYKGATYAATGSEFIEKAGALAAADTNDIHQLNDNGVKYLVKCNAVANTSWVLVSCANYNSVYSDMVQLRTVLIVMAIVFILIAIIVIRFQIKTATKSIGGLTKVIENMTEGDFTVEVLASGNNEITTMSEGLDKFISEMKTVFTNLIQISDNLNEQSNHSGTVSDTMSESAQTQSDSMQQLNQTVDDLAQSIQEIAQNATDLANAVSAVDTDINHANQRMLEVVDVTNEGKESINKVADKMQNIDGVMAQLHKIVKEVGESTKEINNITDVIGDIASQTNLLALNASIEAARAGEAGRGFAVVATEIGSLASSSTDSVENIANIIGKISKEVEEVIKRTEESVADIKDSENLVSGTQEIFMSIYDKVTETDGLFHNITNKTKEVDNVATSMAAITEEQSASTEEILATSENLYQHSVKIADNSKEVKELSEELEQTAGTIHDYMKNFKVDKTQEN